MLDRSTIDRPWFAIQVRPRHELSVAKALRDKGYQELVPLYRQRRVWSDRTKIIECPLFSGYVFCQFTHEAHGPVVTTPGVIRIVGSRQGPLPIDTNEIANIQAVLHAGLPAQPHPYTPVGSRVVMKSGPLAGVECLVKDFRNHNIILSIQLLHRSISVTLDRSLEEYMVLLSAADSSAIALSAQT